MLNTPIFDITHKANVAQAYQTGYSRGVASGSTAINHAEAASFDSVAISEEPASFQKEMVSRISHEIRTSTTTGRIQELRQAVADGTYKPDPARIARCMLYHLEG